MKLRGLRGSKFFVLFKLDGERIGFGETGMFFAPDAQFALCVEFVEGDVIGYVEHLSHFLRGFVENGASDGGTQKIKEGFDVHEVGGHDEVVQIGFAHGCDKLYIPVGGALFSDVGRADRSFQFGQGILEMMVAKLNDLLQDGRGDFGDRHLGQVFFEVVQGFLVVKIGNVGRELGHGTGDLEGFAFFADEGNIWKRHGSYETKKKGEWNKIMVEECAKWSVKMYGRRWQPHIFGLPVPEKNVWLWRCVPEKNVWLSRSVAQRNVWLSRGVPPKNARAAVAEAEAVSSWQQL